VDARDEAAWSAAMRRRGLDGLTIRRRIALARRFDVGVDGWRTAGRADVERWLEQLEVAPATMYATISHLRALYRWARREDVVAVNPMEAIESPRLGRRLPRPARDDAVRLALRTTDLTLRAIVLLMALGGLRCCEVARLRWSDVELDERRLWVRGKRDRDRVVGVGDQLAHALRAVMPFDRDQPVVGWTAHTVSQRVNRHLAHVGAGFTAHQLRHRYATRLLDETHDIVVVQHALGHASIANTQIYAALDVERVLAATERLAL
jgi:site-specific recombinase XerD